MKLVVYRLTILEQMQTKRPFKSIFLFIAIFIAGILLVTFLIHKALEIDPMETQFNQHIPDSKIENRVSASYLF